MTTLIERLGVDCTGHDQSLLATAFRGELVPKDPADEPASVLLDRIRAARAQAGDAPRTRKRHSTGMDGMDGMDGMKTPRSVSPSHASHPSPSKSAVSDAYATLLAALRTQGSLASADIQAATGLDAAAVRPLLQRLVAEGAARVEGQKRGTRYVAR
jgi:type I restriction enzyme S subunit